MKKLCRTLSTALCMALVISQCTVYAAISSDAADKNSTAEQATSANGSGIRCLPTARADFPIFRMQKLKTMSKRF